MSTQEKNSVLSVRGLSKVYKDADASKTILADVSLEVAEREFLCILGPSGCGKTTRARSWSTASPRASPASTA